MPSGYADTDPYLDVLFAVLKNHRRRMIIRLLRDIAPLTPRGIAGYIAVAESDAIHSLEHVDTDRRHAIYTTVYQSHIPKLTDTDIVAYDTSEKTVAHGANFAVASNCLRCVDREVS